MGHLQKQVSFPGYESPWPRFTNVRQGFGVLNAPTYGVFPALLLLEAIHPTVIGTYDQAAGGDAGAALDGLADFILPGLGSIGDFLSIHPPVVRAKNHVAASDDRGAIHAALRAERPFLRAVRGIQAMETFPPVPGEHESVRSECG